jgi:hypothetical protein
MRNRYAFLIAVILLTPQLTEAAILRRFVLVAGANNGGTERETLRYAISDAENFANVLEAMGGVATEDVFVLREPSSAGFSKALDELRQRVSQTPVEGIRPEVVVYYSGHADDRGLLLGGDRLSYQSLRAQIDDVPADVHITVLDACASGAITRLKGGHRRQAFLVDESSRMRGYAFLTSSSADEAAQESDRIGASYFTHYLVSGMRGAADASGDGKVTLSEAYQFAFHETLSTTEETQAGAQHPSYDINLTGTGDVVMTDIRQMSAGLIVGKSLHGRLFIRNEDKQLVAEVYKIAGRTIELGLEPGTYEIHFDQKPAKFKAKVDIKEGERFRLAPEDLYAVDSEKTTSRGETKKQKELKTLSFGIVDRMDQPYDGVQLSLIGNRATLGTGTQISSIFNLADGDVRLMQISGIANIVKGEADGVQIGIANFAKTLDGLQLSVLSIAHHGLGSQIGTVNLSASDFQGFQLGTVNVTGGAMKGLQIGVVNWADDLEGIQIGILNTTTKGLLHTGRWVDETGMAYFTITRAQDGGIPTTPSATIFMWKRNPVHSGAGWAATSSLGIGCSLNSTPVQCQSRVKRST